MTQQVMLTPRLHPWLRAFVLILYAVTGPWLLLDLVARLRAVHAAGAHGAADWTHAALPPVIVLLMMWTGRLQLGQHFFTKVLVLEAWIVALVLGLMR